MLFSRPTRPANKRAGRLIGSPRDQLCDVESPSSFGSPWSKFTYQLTGDFQAIFPFFFFFGVEDTILPRISQSAGIQKLDEGVASSSL